MPTHHSKCLLLSLPIYEPMHARKPRDGQPKSLPKTAHVHAKGINKMMLVKETHPSLLTPCLPPSRKHVQLPYFSLPFQPSTFDYAYISHTSIRVLSKGKIPAATSRDFQQLSIQFGPISTPCRCERKLIEKIVEWVWGKVHRTFKLLDATELVGIKFTREQMDMLLDPADDVRFVGIWGMGGIGKTTIARLVYESISIHFEVSCFLANVREASEGNRLVDLQKQLLFPILKEQIPQVWDEEWGTYFIKNCLCNKKVLLILDDVNASSQLEKFAKEKDWFGKGSIIIITTRDERLVKKHDMEISYKVEGLGDDEALELFSMNAFKEFEPEECFRELCKCFVNYAGGLPLALKILGRSMYKRTQDEWKSELDKLRKILEPDIFDLLKISYDGLDEENQNIFLDVAFFLKGKDKKKVIEILDNCDRCGGINALVEKSLLTIDISKNIVGMHELIQEMAFKIVRQESPEPGRRSRLCHHNDIIHVLITNKATNKIQGIALSMQN